MKISKINFFIIICILLLLLLIPPPLILFVSYSLEQQHIKQIQYIDSQKEASANLSKEIDSMFSNLTAVTYKITKNDDLRKSIEEIGGSDTINELDRLDKVVTKKDATKLLNTYLSEAELALDVIAVSRTHNIVVTSRGWFTKEEYLSTYYRLHDINFDNLKDGILYPMNIIDFCDLPNCENNFCKTTQIITCRIYDAITAYDVAFKIHKNFFHDLINNMTTTKYAGQKILLNDSIIFQNGEITENPNHIYESSSTNLIYQFNFAPMDTNYIKSNNLLIFFLIILSCITLSLMVALAVSNHLYRIYSKVSTASNSEGENSAHKLKYSVVKFELQIDQIIHSNDLLSDKVKYYKHMIDDNNFNLFLNVLISDDSEKCLQEIPENYSWINQDGYYSLSLININDPNISHSSIIFDINNSMSNLLEQHNFNYLFSSLLSVDIALLISYGNESNPNLAKIIENAISGKTNEITIGSMGKGILGIRNAYHQARKLQHQSSENFSKDSDIYFFSTERELQLINTIKLANSSNSKNMLLNIFKENHELNLTKLEFQQLYKMIFGIFERYAKENKYDFSENRISFSSILEEPSPHIEGFLTSVCESISNFVIITQDEVSIKFGKEVYDYIKNNYTDPIICGDSIAENFNISRSTLYKIMKEVSNITIMDLVAKLRIRDAMTLMSESDETINNISKIVGYESYSTFRRIFIGLNGIPPSDYKKNLTYNNP